jgi:hypothetical protein
MIKERPQLSLPGIFSVVILVSFSLFFVSCRTTEEYLVYEQGSNIYTYTECLDKFVVKLDEDISYEEVNSQLDGLGLVIKFDSQLARDVCRKIDGGNFKRDTCWEIAHVRGLEGVRYCAAIMKIHQGKVVNNYGDTIEPNYENTYWEVPGYITMGSLLNYGEVSGFIDSLIVVRELRYMDLESGIYPGCQLSVSEKFRCILECAPELLFGSMIMEQEINREHGTKVHVQQIFE